MLRIATVTELRSRRQLINFARSLENSANDYYLVVYCDSEAHFRELGGPRCEIVELPEVRCLGAQRAKFAAVFAALRGGSVLYLDADAIVLEDLGGFWGGDCLRGIRVDLTNNTAIADRFRPWPNHSELINRHYMTAGGFFAPAGRYSFFDRLRDASLDDGTWQKYVVPGVPCDQHFLSAFVNRCEEQVHFLDPQVFGPEGFLKGGHLRVRRCGDRLVNRQSGKTLRLVLFGETEQVPELLRSLPLHIASFLFERIASTIPTLDDALAGVYAALGPLLAPHPADSLANHILQNVLARLPALAGTRVSTPDAIPAIVFSDRGGALRDSVNSVRDRCGWKRVPVWGSSCGLTVFALPLDEGKAVPFDADTVVAQPRASVTVLQPGQVVLCPGVRSSIRIRLTNTSGSVLSSRYHAPVWASYHWLTRDGQTVVWDGLRTVLPFDLHDGDTAEFPVEFLAPEKEGEYVLKLAVVQEQIAWFDTTPEASVPAIIRTGPPDFSIPGHRPTSPECTHQNVFLIRNPELVLTSRADTFTFPSRPDPIQLAPLALSVLNRFGDSAASVDELFPHADPDIYAAVETLIESAVLLHTEVKCLITGCGRSGTKYMASLLSAAGLHVGHETMGRDGIASWLLAAMPAPPGWGPPGECFHFQTVLHQVRQPLAVIASMQTAQLASWRYICEHIPCSLEDPLLFRCATYWREWNLKAESIATWRYRLEDIDYVWEDLCAHLGLTCSREVLDTVRRDVNSRKGRYQNVSWDDLKTLDRSLCLAIQEQAVRYGYPI